MYDNFGGQGAKFSKLSDLTRHSPLVFFVNVLVLFFPFFANFPLFLTNLQYVYQSISSKPQSSLMLEYPACKTKLIFLSRLFFL